MAERLASLGKLLPDFSAADVASIEAAFEDKAKV